MVTWPMFYTVQWLQMRHSLSIPLLIALPEVSADEVFVLTEVSRRQRFLKRIRRDQLSDMP